MANTAQLYGLHVGVFENTTETSTPTVQVTDGKQIVKMTASSNGYSPNEFVVKAGIPVRWEIEGKEIYGCQGSLQAPAVGVPLLNLKEGKCRRVHSHCARRRAVFV